jgi:hypothetical protein
VLVTPACKRNERSSTHARGLHSVAAALHPARHGAPLGEIGDGLRRGVEQLGKLAGW